MARAIVGNLGETVSKISDYFTNLPKIAAPYTTIQNRAQVTNFAADGLPKFGIERVTIQQAIEMQGELGPNGERVFKAVNDIHDQVRFVGGWNNVTSTYGARVDSANSASSSDYVEITFYGTGLNLLTMLFTSGQDYRVSIDGGAEGANILSTYAATIGARNYTMNNILTVASGLTLGMHTVKIRSVASTTYVLGFEVINTSASIFLPTAQTYIGGRRLYSASTSTTAYNSGFESGTLGTRGGHVLVYQKADGTIAKAVTPTNASPLYLANADHTNEEVVRTYHWREFGAGRTDDFSSLAGTTSNRAFTLDDGTTTLVGNQIIVQTGSDAASIGSNGVGFVTLTFVGTGLDITWNADTTGTNTNANAFEVFVNGTSVGNWDTVSPGANVSRIKRVVSGLPYGTHTVRIFRNSPNAWSLAVSRFHVYAPKTPTLPAGAVALADYFVMANYQTDAASPITTTTISTGILRKTAMREVVYSGTWSVSNSGNPDPTNYSGGHATGTSVTNDYVEFTFFGTGFEFRPNGGANATTAWTMSLNGPANTNWSSYTTGVSAGTTITFTASTGVISIPSFPARGLVYVTGLPLGVHKVRLTKTGGNGIFSFVDCFEVITPIHAPKEVGPARLQNVSLIGSCGVRDLRKFGELQIGEQKALCQAVGVANSTLTTPTAYVPATDMSVTIKTKGGPLFLSHSVCLSNSAGSTGVYAQFYVNGVAVGTEKGITITTATTESVSIADTISIPVPAGVYKVDVYVKNLAGNLNIDATRRNLTVYEI
jgi:hypothetical protein